MATGDRQNQSLYGRSEIVFTTREGVPVTRGEFEVLLSEWDELLEPLTRGLHGSDIMTAED